MSRARAIAAVLLGTLLCQLALAVPALAIERILAARCCNMDCPELPSAGTADRCCAIGTPAAADPSVRGAPSIEPAAPLLALVFALVTRPAELSAVPAPPAAARAAPLYLAQQSLQL